MGIIKKLNQKQIEELKFIVKNDKKHKSRERARAIILYNKGERVVKIAEIVGYSERTIYRWFRRFELERKIDELKGRGRKPILDENDKEKVEKKLKTSNLRETLAEINKEKKVSISTLRRFVKKSVILAINEQKK